MVSVPDERLDRITAFVHPNRTVPHDDGVHRHCGPGGRRQQRRGPGATSFWGHIRSTDAIIHVVRCFEDHNVIHVAGGVNPTHDIDIINTELLLADLETVEKRWAKVEKAVRTATDAKTRSEAEALKKLLEGSASRPPGSRRRADRG